MMPHTVPNKPIKGVTEPVVASQDMPFRRGDFVGGRQCMLTVTACKLFSLADEGLPVLPPTWL